MTNPVNPSPKNISTDSPPRTNDENNQNANDQRTTNIFQRIFSKISKFVNLKIFSNKPNTSCAKISRNAFSPKSNSSEPGKVKSFIQKILTIFMEKKENQNPASRSNRDEVVSSSSQEQIPLIDALVKKMYEQYIKNGGDIALVDTSNYTNADEGTKEQLLAQAFSKNREFAYALFSKIPVSQDTTSTAPPPATEYSEVNINEFITKIDGEYQTNGGQISSDNISFFTNADLSNQDRIITQAFMTGASFARKFLLASNAPPINEGKLPEAATWAKEKILSLDKRGQQAIDTEEFIKTINPNNSASSNTDFEKKFVQTFVEVMDKFLKGDFQGVPEKGESDCSDLLLGFQMFDRASEQNKSNILACAQQNSPNLYNILMNRLHRQQTK